MHLKLKIINPLEISKLKKIDANTTPILKKVNVSTGSGESKFALNIKNKTNMLSESSKDTILSSDDVRFYEKVTNQESLEKAFERLNKGGKSETENWLRKESENATSVDVAEGWILLKQYQDSIAKETDTNTKNELNRSMVELANKITGNSNEALFIRDLKNKWENAYRTQNNNLNGKTNYYIENIASFDENEYNNIKQEILNNLEFANLASIINSDQSVKPGKNIIENIYDYNSGKYKDYEIYYKSSGEFKIIKSKDSGVDSNVKYSKSSDSRNETPGSRQTNNQLGIRVVENTNATSKNDELFDINQRNAYSKRQSNRHDRQNSRGLENSSFSLEEKLEKYVYPQHVYEIYKNEDKSKIVETIEELKKYKERLDTNTD